MKPPPTLIDILYRFTFQRETPMGWRSNTLMRERLTTARRFVLDDAMSTFLGELASASFVGKQPSIRSRIAENLRKGARLPFPVTWIEYNLPLCMNRSNAILGQPPPDGPMPQREGWLLEQHPGIETAFRAHLFTTDDKQDEFGFDVWTFPVQYAWVADDESVIPWRNVVQFSEDSDVTVSEVAVGLHGYQTNRVAILTGTDLVENRYLPKGISNLIKEWMGTMRRMWALLATLNDLPVQVTDVRVAKGFVARGAYRKYLAHRTVTLIVPQKDYRKVARHVVSQAHRGAHDVRAHWRINWHRPLSPLCEHDWDADEHHLTCKICKGQKSHVKAHQRGDASRRLTMHDYSVVHLEEKEGIK